RGRPPEGLLGERPDPVGDLVQKPPFVLEYFREHQGRELLALPGIHCVVIRPGPVADELQRDRGRDALPGCAQVLLRVPDVRDANLLGDRLPGGSILDGGIRMPLTGWDQDGGEGRLASCAGEQVSRPSRAVPIAWVADPGSAPSCPPPR